MNEKDYLSFNPDKPNQRANYLITSFASNYDDLSRKSLIHQINNVDKSKKRNKNLDNKKENTIINKIASYFVLTDPVEWVFIFFFSIINTLFLLFLDKLISTGIAKRTLIAKTSNQIFNFFFWVISSIIFMLLATSVGYFISKDADGSGIPEMKTVLSGITKYTYFSFNAFIGKSLGLFCALVGGASVGKVGPFVHLSCLICNRVMKINYFSKINKTTSLKINMLSVACATGITFALGAPLGGVLFSIESTASVYIVSNLWKAFLSSVICVLIINIFQRSKDIIVIDPKINTVDANFIFVLINFIILGLLTGIIGATCSTLVAKGVYIRNKTKNTWLNSRFKFASIVAIITSISTFFITPLQRNDKFIMRFCFSAYDNSIKKWVHPKDGFSLFICCIFKYIISVLGLCCTMPAGVFGPLFSVGAIFGKFYGHMINKIFKVNLESAFAMAASCGAFSGFSHTISSALMVFEMTGSTKYLSFLLLTSLIANLVGQSLSMGIFDVLLAIKNLPYLPAIKSQTAYTLTAKDIMSKVDYFLEEKNLKIIKALNVMCKMPKNNYLTVPIIDNNGIIKSTVSMQNLYNYITGLYEKVKDNYSYRAQSSFKEFFDFVRKKFFKSNRSFINSIKYKFKKLYLKLKDKERLILNKNFTQESSLRIMTIFEEAVKKDNIFLGKKIQLNDKLLMSDKSILTVEKDYLVLKIQFLFTFLNISHIYVTDEGKLIGIITKQDFINKTQK